MTCTISFEFLNFRGRFTNANFHLWFYYFKNNLKRREKKNYILEHNFRFCQDWLTAVQKYIYMALKTRSIHPWFNSWINAEAESCENAECRTAADFTDSLRLFIQFLGKKPRKTVWPPLKAHKKCSDLLWIISVVLPCTPLCISFHITYSNGEQKVNINK